MARTIKLYRIENDGRRLAAGAIRATSPDDLTVRWQLGASVPIALAA
jgi:hypothetical protein